ncbi:hypothetical protein QO200_05315 [Flavobacterium sp. Arc3]|uniref:hypothetical protein n=1 Tax=unclassified Flavobacterium TaxID=196869 RepID=UPI00352C6B61
MYLKITLILSLMLLSTGAIYAQDKPEVTIGGALRFNYNLSSWKEGQKKRGGDFGYDVFRINAKAKYKGIKLNAEYRLYSEGFGGGMLKQGWLAYDFDAKNEIQVGLTQVPFGITTYNSNNWFFSINYYIGLEDDHDMGVKFTHTDKKWNYALAFFKNAEELKFGSNSDVSDSRYSYDVASIDLDGDGILDLRNKETNQVNGKLNYTIGNDSINHKIGTSVQYGGLYNLDTQEMGSHYAAALHYELKYKRFGVKAQVSTYKKSPKNPNGESDEIIAMTAYGAPYLVAAEGNTYTLGVQYTVPVKWGPVSSLQFYNDYGYLEKINSDFKDSAMNVTGVLVSAGNVYTYFDVAAGRDQPWLGPVWKNALANGTDNANWEVRFNMNIGYYF